MTGLTSYSQNSRSQTHHQTPQQKSDCSELLLQSACLHKCLHNSKVPLTYSIRLFICDVNVSSKHHILPSQLYVCIHVHVVQSQILRTWLYMYIHTVSTVRALFIPQVPRPIKSLYSHPLSDVSHISPLSLTLVTPAEVVERRRCEEERERRLIGRPRQPALTHDQDEVGTGV